MTNNRHYSSLDKLCLGLDQALRAVFGKATTTERLSPATDEAEAELTAAQRKATIGLMRVNHAGEVCAQALYHGQSLISRDPLLREKMRQAAIEEGDHLAWCHQRLEELGSHTSYLNPVWYIGSFTIGLTAGLIGDEWSLGFVAETENQVVKHLEHHLSLLPVEDQKSIKILQQMRQDEALHRDEAITAGAATLPQGIKKLMNVVSKIMVKTAFWI
jgi:ubiquinone biosynthesis monooxygenase Coq7